jgi:hypothetical protein
MAALLFTGCTSHVRPAGVSYSPAVVEFRNLSPASFNPNLFNGSPNFLPDIRSPFLDPLPGPYRNIYAPSIVCLPDHSFRIFFGGWDGTPTGNDQIYSIDTADFITFHNRQTVITHSPYQHVCNVSAVLNPDQSITLFCTAFPDSQGLNRIISIRVPAHPPVTPTPSDLISIKNYPNYSKGDFNGLNPVLYNPLTHTYQLFFADFHNFGHIYRASSTNAHDFTLDADVLDAALMPNDAKQLSNLTLLAFHQNGPSLFYSLSADPLHFPPPKLLATHLSDADRYIVAVGLVVDQHQSLLGFLYGAGAVPSLDHNRIFARWLQRKVIFLTNDGRQLSPSYSFGPGRALLDLPSPTIGRLQLYSEDGTTLLLNTPPILLTPGHAYTLQP